MRLSESRIVPACKLAGVALALFFLCSTVSTTAATDGDKAQASKIWPYIALEGPWEVVYNGTSQGCSYHDVCDSMPIAWYNKQLRQATLISAISFGPIANTGRTLDDVPLNHDCKHVVYNSTFDVRPESFANFQWLQSVHLFPNGTAYGLIHNEFHGFQESALGYCSKNKTSGCAMWSTGLGISHDGGQTFELVAPPPRHLVAAAPYRYVKDQPMFGYGAISTMLPNRDSSAFLGMIHVTGKEAQPSGICPFRTTSLAHTGSFRAWNGTAFASTWANPYLSDLSNTTGDHICIPLNDSIGITDHPSPRRLVGFPEGWPTYLMTGMGNEDSELGQITYVASWEADFEQAITNWTQARVLNLGLARYTVNESRVLYPALLDSNAPHLTADPAEGINYELVSNKTAYLYCVLDRNLIVRRRAVFTQTSPPAPPPPAPPAPPACVAFHVEQSGDAASNGIYNKTPDTSDGVPVFVKDEQHELYRFQGRWRVGKRDQIVLYVQPITYNASLPPSENWRAVRGPIPAPLTVECTACSDHTCSSTDDDGAVRNHGSSQHGGSRTFNVLDFGAVGDGRTNDTAAIRKALLAARAAGGGTVLLPTNHTFLSGSLHMENNTGFLVEAGAMLLGSPIYADYPHEMLPAGPVDASGRPTGTSYVRQSLIAGASCLHAAPQVAGSSPTCLRWDPLVNVTITGGGVIDGNGANWWWAFDAGNPATDPRPDMVKPGYVHGLFIHDIELRASPAWTVHLLLSQHVRVSRVTVDAGVFFDDHEYLGHNVDGVDPDSCIDVVIEDSFIRAGDDCVAVYSMQGPTADVLVRNLTCHTPLSVTHGHDTRNVTFEDCTVIGTWGNDATGVRPRWFKTAMRLKSDRKTNGTFRDILYRNITGVGVDLLADIQMWYPCHNDSRTENYLECRSHYPVLPGVRPRFENIRFEHIRAEQGAWRSGWLNCLPESPCENVTFSDFHAPGALPFVCENVHGSATKGSVQPWPEDCFSSAQP